MSLFPEYHYALGTLAQVRTAQKRYQEAADLYGRRYTELVLYYVDDAGKPGDALQIAQLEATRRHDVHTFDCLAWALHANHQDEQAKAKIDEALAVGVKDPQILYHAKIISLGCDSSPTCTLKAGSRGLYRDREGGEF